MYSILENVEETQIIDKSKFIARLYRVSCEQDVLEILTNIRKQHSDANHNCYAYIYGERGEYQRCSDDGEPSQTAGAPMLNVLQKNNLTNVLAVVTRYFGGIKLGAGGLVRAYSISVVEALEVAELTTFMKVETLGVTIKYPYYEKVNRSLSHFGIDLIDSDFSSDIQLELLVPEKNCEQFKNTLSEITAGSAVVSSKGVSLKEIKVLN